VEVPVTKTTDSAKRVVQILNTALSNLGPEIGGLNISEEDVVNASAEWTAIKSDASLQRGNPHRMRLIAEDVDDLSIQQKYQKLSDDTASDIVVLHCHGGMMYCLRL